MTNPLSPDRAALRAGQAADRLTPRAWDRAYLWLATRAPWLPFIQHPAMRAAFGVHGEGDGTAGVHHD